MIDKHNTDYFLQERPGMLCDLPREIADTYNFGHWYCGFSSIEQLEQWFDEEDRKTFDRWGFDVVQYKSNDFVVGRKGNQIFFIREDCDARS